MIMRGWAYSMLTDPARSASLLAIVPADRINSSGSGTPTAPFIVIRSRIVVRRFEGATRQGGFTIHVHDKPESYVKIDQIADLVDAVLMGAVPMRWKGKWVSQIEHLGWSEDLFDDHYGTATRNGTFALNHSA